MTPRFLDRLLPVGLYALALALLAHAARALALTAQEPAALAAAEDVARRLASPGPLIARLAGAPSLLPAGLPAATASLWGSSLGALRAGIVLAAAFLPPLVYGIALRSSGRWLAAAAALFALLVPRALLEGATLGGDGLLTVLLWGGFWAHLSARGKPDRAALSGVFFAASLAVSWSALLALPVLVLHRAWTQPEAAPLLPRGRFAAPLSAVAFVLLALPLFWMLTPALWRFSGGALRDLLVAAASPEVLAGEWAGDEVTPDVVPRFHTAWGLLTALPSVTSVLAVVGIWKFRTDGTRQRPDLALAALVLLIFGAWPLLCPPGLGRFPGRFAVLVPAAGLLASRGLGWLWEGPVARIPWTPRWRVISLASLLFSAPLLACTAGAATLSSDFSWLTGGLRRPAAWGPEPLHDGSAVGGVLAAIEAEGEGTVALYSPDIPHDVWKTLQRLGRLRRPLRLVSRPEQADLAVLSPGRKHGGFRRVLAVRRDGCEILSLWRRVVAP